ncbi:MAG: ATP-binding protein, partial [Chloroflexota bacterium]
HKQRLLNMLLVVFAPLSITLSIIDNLNISTGSSLFDKPGSIAVLVGIIIFLAGVFYFSRRGAFNIIIPILFVIAFAVIYFNSSITSLPHTEIIYLSLIIFLASDLFRPLVTLIVAGIAIMLLTIFFLQTPSLPQEMYSDIRLFFIVCTVFTLFISYHRDQLEKDRQAIIIQERLRLQLVLENLPVFVWTADSTLETVTLNGNSRMTAETENALQTYLHSEQALHHHQQLASAPHKSYTFSFFLGSVPYEASVQMNKSLLDGEQGYIGVAYNISERLDREILQQREKNQQNQQRVLDEFLNSVSHDLRTPLSVLGTSTYIMERTQDPDQRARQIGKMKRATTHLQNTFDAMLTLVRLNTSNDTYQPINFSKLIEASLDELENTRTERRITFDWQPAEAPLSVLGNESQLKRVCLEITKNALQYSPTDSTVTIRTYAEDDFTILEVRDTGVGMDASISEDAFNAFFRGEGHRPINDDNNIGIGLTIAKRIVERHNGQIELQSAPAEGTNVTVRLPRILKE